MQLTIFPLLLQQQQEKTDMAKYNVRVMRGSDLVACNNYDNLPYTAEILALGDHHQGTDIYLSCAGRQAEKHWQRHERGHWVTMAQKVVELKPAPEEAPPEVIARVEGPRSGCYAAPHEHRPEHGCVYTADGDSLEEFDTLAEAEIAVPGWDRHLTEEAEYQALPEEEKQRLLDEANAKHRAMLQERAACAHKRIMATVGKGFTCRDCHAQV